MTNPDRLDGLLEMLEAWMSFNRQSILDGTISCKACAVLVLEENAERHSAWHRDHAMWNQVGES